MFGAFKRALGAGAKEVQKDYSGNRNFLEAVIAASTLVAAADGDLEDAERNKIQKIVTNHATLGKFYKQQDIEAVLDRMFKLAKDASGKQQLARELDDVKSSDEAMRDDVYLVALDIAHADGELEPQEADVLNKIAKRIGVDVSKFEF